MGAHVIDGRGLAAELKGELAAEVAGLRDAGAVPGLATVLAARPPRRRSTRGVCARWAGDGEHEWHLGDWYNACWICEGERII